MKTELNTPHPVASDDPVGRLEALRRKLCSVGLHPQHHDTPEKAAFAVCEMIAYFRRELADPPADVCGLVLKKYGVEGFTGEDKPRCRLVALPAESAVVPSAGAVVPALSTGECEDESAALADVERLNQAHIVGAIDGGDLQAGWLMVKVKVSPAGYRIGQAVSVHLPSPSGEDKA
jgi:hypothetical protein